VKNVPVDDLVDVGAVHVGVPDRVGIDDEARPLFATVEAPRLVDPHLALPGLIERPDPGFGVGLQLQGAVVGAAGLRRRPLVAAEEHVALVIAHGGPGDGKERRGARAPEHSPIRRL